ncbi:MAG: HAD family phosphatase [Firmicutes bacterium]|nr:HAD family phosphatase [Bacillota bacterium]
MIKLIASDVDDTLLCRNAQVSAKNQDAIRQAVEAGITFTLATGRMFQATVPFAKSLGLAPEQPLICYNGALIRRVSGEVIYEQPLPADVSSLVVEYGQSRGWTINAYFDDELYVSTLNQEVIDYAEHVRVKVTPVGDLLKFIEDGPKKLSKLMIISEPQDTLERIEELRPLVGDRCQLLRSRPKFIEITNREAHKGNALLWLAKSLGLDASQVLAIGDSQNDLTMIQMAGVGVAVANAGQEVQAAADHVVARHEEDGVAQAIFDFALKQAR